MKLVKISVSAVQAEPGGEFTEKGVLATGTVNAMYVHEPIPYGEEVSIMIDEATVRRLYRALPPEAPAAPVDEAEAVHA